MPNLRAFARTLVNTRNLAAARALHTTRRSVRTIRMVGWPGTFRLRTGTTDAEFLRGLANGWGFSEYALPIELRPRTILDIGANIGAVTLLFHRRFPDARIFAFEPLPENFALLAHNVAALTGVRAIPYGLGARTQECTYTLSDDASNHGGGGFHYGGEQGALPTRTLTVLATAEALERYDIRDMDLIKIDAEGAKHEILTSIPAAVMAAVKVIVGELHGDQSPLLDYLRRWFDVTPIKRNGVVRYFNAVNREYTATAPRRPPSST